jgi:hypothetical protein
MLQLHLQKDKYFKKNFMFYLTVFSSIEDLNLQNIRLQVVNLETGRLERTFEANKQGEVSM